MQQSFTCQNGGNPAIKFTRFHTEANYDYLTINFGTNQFMRTFINFRQILCYTILQFYLGHSGQVFQTQLLSISGYSRPRPQLK